MSGNWSARDEASRIEHLLEEAEKRAREDSRQAIPSSRVQRNQASDHDLVRAAQCELERHRQRARYLAGQSMSALAWTIMLDMFISFQQKQDIALIGCGERWGVSDGTAVRQLVALIADNLVMRVNEVEGRKYRCVRLTEKGYETIARVLELYT